MHTKANVKTGLRPSNPAENRLTACRGFSYEETSGSCPVQSVSDFSRKGERYDSRITARLLERRIDAELVSIGAGTCPNQNHHRRRGDEPADDSAAPCARAGAVCEARHGIAHRSHQGRADF